jgi:hypothetical protein
MKKFIGIIVLGLSAILFFNCGSSVDIAINKLYSKSERAEGIKMLSKLSPEKTFDKLINVMSAQDEDIVNAGIEILKAWGPEATIDKLVNVLDQTDNLSLAGNCAAAIGKIGGPKAEDILIEHLNDSRIMVVVQSLLGLGLLKSAKSIDTIAGFLKSENINDPTLPMAIDTLAKIGNKNAVPKLEVLLNSDISSVTLKINIIKAINTIDSAKGYEIAEKEIKDTGDIRYITSLLGVFEKIGNSEIIPVLKDIKPNFGPGIGKKIDEAITEIEKNSK